MLFWQMRLGKTRTALAAFNTLYERGEANRLVVVTKAIGKEVWRKEAEEMGLGIPVILCYGREALHVRPEGFIPASVPRILVLNWEIAEAWLPVLEQTFKNDSVVLVTDEGHEYLRNPANLRYKAVKELSLTATRTWELTGTLYVTSVMDVYHQLRLLGGKANPFQYWPAVEFGGKFGEASFNPWKGRIVRGPDGRPLTYASGKPKREGSYDFRGLAEGAEVEILARCPAISKLMEVDIQAQTVLPIRIPHWLDADGAYLDYRPNTIEKASQAMIDFKVGQTLGLLEALEERPIVIFGWHLDYTHRLLEALLTAGINAALVGSSDSAAARADCLQRFALGQIDVLVGNLKSLGTAVDLSRARHAIYGEPYWDAALQRQAEARLGGPRQQSRHVIHHYLLTADSPDEYIWDVCYRKGEALDRFDAVERTI